MNCSTPERLAKSSFLALLTCLLAGFMLFGSVYADVPSTMTYQGRLTTPEGAPMPGMYNMAFRICPPDSCGCPNSPLWTEEHNGDNQVEVNDFGLFEVILGSITPISPSIFPSDGSTPLLEVLVNGEPLRPCKPLNSVPYAQVPSGEVGPTGPAGPTGPTGPAGPTGAPGAWSLVASTDFVSQPSVQITGLSSGKYYKVFFRFIKNGPDSSTWALVVNSVSSGYMYVLDYFNYSSSPGHNSEGCSSCPSAKFIVALYEHWAIAGEMMISTDPGNPNNTMAMGHCTSNGNASEFYWHSGVEPITSFTIESQQGPSHTITGNITVYELGEE